MRNHEDAGGLARLKHSASLLALAMAALPLGAAHAQQTQADSATVVGEIVVTASRRSETVSKLPFNISAYGSEQLAQGNVTSIVGLTQQVPNFTIQNGGARSQASAIPIIRGINASQQQSLSARYFQSPVGFYLDNAPITGAFPLFDVERIEVLRGPQGTLYGAGALSGAVRVVPNKPKFDGVSGMVTASASDLAHSGNANYDVGGAINIPLSDTFAIRASARQGYEAGFIDQKDIFVRQNGDYRYGAPVLANPADVAGSKGVLFNKDDANYSRTTSFRAEALWQPTDATEVSLSYNYAQVKGNGGPVDNPSYNGGAFPIDPRISIGDLKEYERSLPMLEPFDRRNDLAALDVSHDLGFATLSTTVALGQTKGFSLSDQTVALIGVPYGAYYTGVPANPRTVVPVAQGDRERSVTEEIRLVSNDEGPITYIAGVFMQQMRKNIDINIYDPGAGAQSAAANGGSTLPMALGGTYVLTNADGQSYEQHTTQHFKDYSAYGELSWKVTDRLKLTGGARFFHQTFRQDFTSDSTFFFFSLNEQQKSDVSSQIFKASASYQLADNLQAYGTWSQGFRRGGANSFPLSGPVLEPKELLVYKPDKTDNFELGVKGTLNGVFVAADVFYVDWKDPQIDLLTPFNLSNAVVNAKGATSKGFEVEARGPIGDRGLSFNLGFAYAKARLSDSFSLPAGSGIGTVVANAIRGSKGDRLPGAPDWSGSFTLNYKTDLGDSGQLLVSGGVDYRGSTLNALETPDGSAVPREAPSSTTLRGNISYTHQDWTIEVFGTNLTDERSVISYARRTASAVAKLGAWSDANLVIRPREVGVRVTRSF